MILQEVMKRLITQTIIIITTHQTSFQSPGGTSLSVNVKIVYDSIFVVCVFKIIFVF